RLNPSRKPRPPTSADPTPGHRPHPSQDYEDCAYRADEPLPPRVGLRGLRWTGPRACPSPTQDCEDCARWVHEVPPTRHCEERTPVGGQVYGATTYGCTHAVDVYPGRSDAAISHEPVAYAREVPAIP